MEQKMKEELSLLQQSLKDFLTPKMLKYSLLPFVVTLIAMYFLFFILVGTGLDQLESSMSIQSSQTLVQNRVAHTQSYSAQYEGNEVLQFLMSYALTSGIVSFLVYTVGAFVILYLSVFVAILVIGFLTPYVLRELQQRHYPNLRLKSYSNPLSSLLTTLKYLLIMFALVLLLIPFYFIPLLNIILLNLPLYYFFHKMLNYDISTNMTTKEEALEIRFKNRNKLRFKTLFLYFLSMIPFVIFFTSVFFVIYLGHTYFLETQKLRSDDTNSSNT